MINKKTYSINEDHKVLHKVGKRWVTVSTLLLGLIGGATMVAHGASADATTSTNTNTVKANLNHQLAKQPQSNASANVTVATKPSNSASAITNQAKQMHRGLMLDSPRPTSTTSSSASASAEPSSSSNSSNQAKSSSNDNDMNILQLGTHSQQARGWNFVQNGVRNHDYDNYKPSSNVSSKHYNSVYENYLKQNPQLASLYNSINPSKLKNQKPDKKHDLTSNRPLLKDNINYFSGKVTKTGNDDGLNYKVFANGGVEFTNGTAKSDLSQFSVKVVGFSDTPTNRDILNAKAIKFDSQINTSNVTNMSNMFNDNFKLQSLDLGNSFDTSKVTNMKNTFASDNNLQSLNLGNHFDTSNVTNMNNMFGYDRNLQSLNLGNHFDTSNVTNMSDMFENDRNLQSLNLGNHFDTSKVADMTSMFSFDRNLQSLDLGNQFDTSKVAKMTSMFSYDRNLQSLDLGNHFDTSKVADMSNMFENDAALQSLNLGNHFDTSKVADMSYMFENDNTLQSFTTNSNKTKLNNDVDFPVTLYQETGNYDINNNPYTNLTTPSDSINNDANIKPGTYIKNKNIEPITATPQKNASDGHWIYYNSGYLSDGEVHDWTYEPSFDNGLTDIFSPSTRAREYISGSAIILSDVASHSNSNGIQAVSIKLDGNIDTSKLTSIGNDSIYNAPFRDSDLISLDVENGFDTSKISNAQGFFSRIPNVQSILLGNKVYFNNSNSISDMYNSDTNIKSITLPSDLDTKNIPNMWQVFKNDTKLRQITFPKGFDTRKALKGNNSISSDIDPGDSDMFYGVPYQNNGTALVITITSPNTKFSKNSKVPTRMYRVINPNAINNKNNPYTTLKPPFTTDTPSSDWYKGNSDWAKINNVPTDFINNNIHGSDYNPSHHLYGNVGTWSTVGNPADVIGYYVMKNGQEDYVGYQGFKPTSANSDTVTVNKSNFNVANYHLTKANYTFPFNCHEYDILVAPNQEANTVEYTNNLPGAKNYTKTVMITGAYGASAQSDIENALPSDCSIKASAPYDSEFANNNLSRAVIGSKGTKLIVAVKKIKIVKANEIVHFYTSMANQSSSSVSTIEMSGALNRARVPVAPSNYSLANPKQQILIDNGTSNVQVVPNQESDTIHYSYNGKPVSSTIVNVLYNTPITIDSANANEYHLPSGYYVSNGTNVSFSNSSANVNVKADSASETVDYNYNNGTISSHTFNGSSAMASLASDTSTKLSNSSDSGMPAYYHLSNSASSVDVPFNNGSMSVAVVPDTATDTINYMFNGHQISNSTISGNDVSAKGANNTYATIAAPINYHLANNTNSTSIAYDGKTHQINIVPNNETNAIKYMYNGNQVGSTASISGAFNAPAQSAIDQHLPNGYKFINNDDNLKFDNESQRQINVTVASDATDIVGFYDSRNNNLVGRVTIKQPKGSICTITRQQVPTGWHLVNNTNQFQVEPNITSNIRVMQDNIPAKDQPNYAIPVAPTIVSDSITYNNGKGWTTQKKINGQTGTSAKSDVDKNLPIGYQVSGNSDTFNYPESNSTKIIGIKPIVNNEKVFYKDTANNYKVIASASISGNDSSAQNASDTSFNANSKLPQGYQLAENQPTNIAYDGYNHDIDITPIKQTDTVIFINNDNHKTVETKSISGNDYRTHDNGIATVKLPISYHLAKGQSNVVNYDSTTHQISINYDGTKHHISIIPNTANIDVNYQYNGTTISSHMFNGNNSSAKNASDTTVHVTSSNEPNIPQGYHLANTNNTFSYDNNSHNVAILPNHVSDTINYQYNGKTLSSNRVGGNDYRATNAHDNSIDITSSNDSGIPQGYHLSNTNNTFNYDGNTHNVIIEPNTDTDIVDYNYGNQTLSNHDFSGNDSHATNAGNNSFEINDTNEPGIPDGYHLANKENSFNYDNQTHIVQIVPNNVSDIINYRLNNQIIASHTFHGNDYRATAAGNNIVNINNNNVLDMPRGYTLVNKNNQFNYDGQNHNVAIKPIQDTDEIDYVYNNQILAHHNFTGNDQYAVQAGNINFDINKQNDPDLPQGYQLINDDNQFKYDNKKHLVDIKPILQTDTIDYQLNNQTISSHQFTGNDYRASQAGNNSFSITNTDAPGIPQGYALVNSNNTFNYDGQSHNIAIKATNQNATVQYYSPNGTLIYKGIIKGNVGTKVQLNPPAGYHNNGAIPIYYFNPANASHNPSARINVAPNTINGKAIIHIKYALNNPDGTPFKIINGNDQYVNINGKYGDSPIVISPIQYQPTNDAYHSDVTNKPFSINISNLTKDGSKSNYTISDTFTYDATEAPNLVLHYDVISNNNGSVKRNNICENVYKPSDLGIRLQDWVIGNTITLHDGNQHGTTNVIHAPYGYHLMPQAKGFAYHNGSETIVLKPNAIDKITKRPIMLMAMPLFVRHVAPKPKPAHHVQPKPSPIVPSDNRTNQPKVVPSDEIAKIIARAKVNQPKVVSNVTPSKSSKAQNKPSQVIVNKHTKHNRVNRNNNDKSAKSSTVSPTTYSKSNYANNYYDDNVSLPDITSSNVGINTPYKNNTIDDTDSHSKLPQTGDSNRIAGMASVIMLLTSITLAGADLDRKHRLD